LKSKYLKGFISIASLLLIVAFSGCGFKYSFSGAATSAKTIQVDQFFNNTDLGPANLGQTFTNSLKDYYQRNSSLKVVTENAELQIDGSIITYSVTNIAPVSSADQTSVAALSRLTIAVKVNYNDNNEPKNSFKDKSFSFYADFPNEQNLSTVQEDLEKKIFDQILIDIFNATVANW
jgi:Lipopolysaccharide-assembly